MDIDLDLLDSIERSFKPAYQAKGIGALVRGIHKDSSLQEWLTLESVALVPIPFIEMNQWRLLSLITVPTTIEGGEPGYYAPWGALCWTGNKVSQKYDLRTIPTIESIRALSPAFSAQPADKNVALEAKSRIVRERTLYAALDYLCESIDHASEVINLASHYSGILPQDIYPYYHALVPDSKNWLDQNVSALSTLG